LSGLITSGSRNTYQTNRNHPPARIYGRRDAGKPGAEWRDNVNKVIEETIAKLTELDQAITEMAYIFSTVNPCITGVEACYSLPYDFELIKINRKEFEEHGFSFQHEQQWTDDGVLGQWFYRGEIGLCIFYRPHMEGSTCKINKIGERTKVIPVYEVTCLEA
jgi:hypothetical protein